jgi:hypothetical protein
VAIFLVLSLTIDWNCLWKINTPILNLGSVKITEHLIAYSYSKPL